MLILKAKRFLAVSAGLVALCAFTGVSQAADGPPAPAGPGSPTRFVAPGGPQ